MGDNLSPAGSSSYSSNTMTVGDGTWDASRNDFLLPNLMGLNFETMRYNGMGNRFASMPQYHSLIKGHAILAVIAFLFCVPIAILMAQFYHRSPFWALRMHIYLQILTVALSTVVFTLGWFAVGPNRSLTNPHHGIGTAIYVLVLVQALGGCCIHGRAKKRVPRRLPLTVVLHQWVGRAIALLGFAQVPLGLTLYGSPKFTFILYSLWMTFLLVLFFILSYRARPDLGLVGRESSHGGTVIEDRKPSRFGGLLGPLAAGAGAAALLSRRDRSHSRSRREEVIPSRRGSRRGSGSYVEDEKFEERRKEGGGVMDKLMKGAAVLGAAGLAKSWYDRRQRRRDEEEYSSVAMDTPSRRNERRRRHSESDFSESVVVNRMEEGRPRRSNILPGPGDPVATAAAISAAESGPATPRPVTPKPVRRRDSYSSESESEYTISPSRRPQSTHKARNGLLAGIGLGFIAKKMKDRRDRKELERLDRIEADRIEDERRARRGNAPARLTGDGFPTSRRHGRRGSYTESSLMSSIDDPHSIHPGAIPPIPTALAAGAGAAAAAGPSQSKLRHESRHESRHDVATDSASMPTTSMPGTSMPTASMPPAPPDPHGILHSESGSEAYTSAGGHPHRRHSSRRRKEGEAAAATAATAALALEEENRRHRSRSRTGEMASKSGNITSPPVSVKMKIHDDKDRHVTLRRLTEEEAAAEREARRTERRRRRADSVSSLSGTDTAASRQRFRRPEREAERRAESSVAPAPPPPPPPQMAPLSPPNPAFAAGRRPKDSAYYSGRPGEPPASSQAGLAPPSVGSQQSHGTWSALSPSVSGTGTGIGGAGAGADGADVAAERRRRRRLERNQRGGSTAASGAGVEFS